MVLVKLALTPAITVVLPVSATVASSALIHAQATSIVDLSFCVNSCDFCKHDSISGRVHSTPTFTGNVLVCLFSFVEAGLMLTVKLRMI